MDGKGDSMTSMERFSQLQKLRSFADQEVRRRM